MAYTKNTWATGDTITKVKLDNLETQYDAASADLTTHKNDTANPHGVTAAQAGAVPTTEKGAANGVATLDANGDVPASQLDNAPIPASSAYFVTGTYTGDGAASQAINLGFQPSAIHIQQSNSITDGNNGGTDTFYGGFATSKNLISGSNNVIILTTTGFNVYYDAVNRVYVNTSGGIYSYIAFK